MTPCLDHPNTRTADEARAAIDLSRPSYAAAYQHARAAAVAHAKACGRGLPTRADKAAGDAVMINLLHHVEGDQGGFLGLSDAALEAYCARKGYDLAAVISAMYAPTPWPVPQAVAA
jgi:hypothetical protein